MRGDKIPHTSRDTPNHRTMSRHTAIQYTPTIPGTGTKHPIQGVTRPITAQIPRLATIQYTPTIPCAGSKHPTQAVTRPIAAQFPRLATIQYTPTIPGAGTKYPTQGVTRPITAQCPISPRFNTRQRSQARGQNTPPMKFSPLCPANHPFFRLSSHDTRLLTPKSRQKAKDPS